MRIPYFFSSFFIIYLITVLQDGRFALVEGRPQRIIGFWRIKDVIRISFISNVLHFFAHDPSGVDDGMYSLACGKIEEIEKHFSMCKKAVNFKFYYLYF